MHAFTGPETSAQRVDREDQCDNRHPTPVAPTHEPGIARRAGAPIPQMVTDQLYNGYSDIFKWMTPIASYNQKDWFS